MSALDEVIRNYKRFNPFGSGHQQLVDDATAELAKLTADYTATVKANAELAHLNADLQEQLAAQSDAIAAAREALADARSYASSRRIRSGIVNASAARVADKCAAALAALDGAKPADGER